jgi:STE24 endopeptidase
VVLLAAVCCVRPALAEEEPAPAPAAHAMVSGGPPTPEEQARAHQRARESRTLFLTQFLYEALLLGLFLGLGGTRWLAKISAHFGESWVWAVLAVAAIIGLASTLLTLPFDYYGGFVVQHRWGLSNQTAAAWFRDYLVGGAVSLVITLPLLLLFYWLLRAAPSTWPLWMTLAMIPVSIFLMIVQPVFIAPLFNKFTPLQDETLRRDLLALAHRQGISANDVFQVDASRQSKAVNAYVNGFGPTHRIVLYDTLLQDFTHEEIEFVLAHEMGHYKLGHIARGILIAVAFTFLGAVALLLVGRGLLAAHGGFFGAGSLADPAVYPLLLAIAMLLGILGTPATSALSRQMEWQADRYAVRVYGHPEAGISAFHKLARLNISEEQPPAWVEYLLSSHPSIHHRIQALEHEE